MKNINIVIFKYGIVFFIGFFLAMLMFINEDDFQIYSHFTQNSERIPIFAVNNNNQGIAGYALLRTVKGNDKVLIESSPFNEIDLQESITKAVNVAKKILGIKKTDLDFLFSFEFDSLVVGGESAGVALTILTISTLTKKEIKKGVGITGTIESDGTIGRVGGILEKLIAAKKAGIKTFLIPKGQADFTYYEPVVESEKIFGFELYNTKYVSKTINLKKYAKTKLGINLVEVENIYDALPYFFNKTQINSIK